MNCSPWGIEIHCYFSCLPQARLGARRASGATISCLPQPQNLPTSASHFTMAEYRPSRVSLPPTPHDDEMDIDPRLRTTPPSGSYNPQTNPPGAPLQTAIAPQASRTPVAPAPQQQYQPIQDNSPQNYGKSQLL